MRPLVRKLFTRGNSRAVTIPREFIKYQNNKSGYMVIMVLSEQDLAARGYDFG